MLELLPGERLCEPVSWHIVRLEIDHIEFSSRILLAQPHILDIYVTELRTDPLVLANDQPNSLLVISEDSHQFAEVKADRFEEPIQCQGLLCGLLKCQELRLRGGCGDGGLPRCPPEYRSSEKEEDISLG